MTSSTSHHLYPHASKRAHALGWLMAATVRPLASTLVRSPEGLMALRKTFRGLGTILKRSPKAVRITPVHQADVRGEWVVAARAQEASRVVLYLHGGGYFFGSGALHRQVTWRLSDALARPVLAIDYRLAPRHSFEAWRDDAVSAYQHLLNQGYAGSDITVAGDSAGGHLTLVLLQTLRDRGISLPRAAICISPWTDLSGESLALTANSRRDPYIPANALRFISRFLTRNRSPFDALVSPVHGDFRGLPPIYVMVGSTEILRDDARRMVERARSAGVSVRYEEWHRMPHVFPIMAAVLPEGRLAFRQMRDFIVRVEAPALSLVA
ncbi:MAG: alpha/beta hydrolase [Paraperlucidibaca sp.]